MTEKTEVKRCNHDSGCGRTAFAHGLCFQHCPNEFLIEGVALPDRTLSSKERDIAARLRAAHPNSPQYALGSMLLSEAADEIERLRKFIETRCIGSGGASDAERWHMINEWNKAKAAMSGEQPPRSAHETRPCAGCERGLPLDGHGHHYGRISNTGPLAPYYLDLTVCTTLKASASPAVEAKLAELRERFLADDPPSENGGQQHGT